MSTTTSKRPRRSLLMWLLRVSACPLVLAFLAGGAMLVASYALPEAGSKMVVRDVGYHLFVGAGALVAVVLWGGVYLQVVEASRGMPGLRTVEEPVMQPAAAQLRSLQAALSGLGFRHTGWFALDDFDETHVGAWRHDEYPAVVFVLYAPTAGTFRLRIIRKFPSGGVLVSSTRVTELSYPPPQGMYLQAKKGASVEELWAWHLEAEALFPDATDRTPCDTEAGGPRELYVGVSARRAVHRRRDRTWLLAVEPVGECWRMYHLCGMPLSQQFELGWTNPYWQ